MSTGKIISILLMIGGALCLIFGLIVIHLTDTRMFVVTEYIFMSVAGGFGIIIGFFIFLKAKKH